MAVDAARRRPFLQKYRPWAVVTGASSGIGRQLAIGLAGAGVHLVLVARRADVLHELSRGLSERHGVDVRVLVADPATGTAPASTYSRRHPDPSTAGSPLAPGCA